MDTKLKNENNDVSGRFANTTGKDYEIFTQAYPHYEELQESIAKSIKKETSESFVALEIGCGPGETTEVVAIRFKNAKIVAVDNEPIMLTQAKYNLKGFGNRVTFTEADALTYLRSLNSSTIDVFFSGFTIHNFPVKYRLEFLKEIYRVLKKDGLFVNGDKYALDNISERYKAFNWAIQQFLTFYPMHGRDDVCYDWIIHMSEDELPDKLMVESPAIKIMQELAFKDVEVVWRKKMEAILIARK